jgi:glutamine phosphoribosylpyrophosphate amidotransferase
MCGIVYVKRADGKPAQKQVLKRYTKQKTRGDEGFGYVCLNDRNHVTAYKRHQYEKETRKELEQNTESHILFHHRFPTSTPNIPESAHPIKVSHKELSYDYYVVHNGVISNDSELRDQHLALGYKYTTEVQMQWNTPQRTWLGRQQWNDSEAFAIEIARNIDRKTERTGAEGPIAYIVLQVEKASKKAIAVYYGTNGGNPLTIWEDKLNGNVCIASEGGKRIISNTCYRLDLDTNEITIDANVKMKAYGSVTSYGYSTSGYNFGTGTGYEGYSQAKSAYDFSDWEPEDIETEIEELEVELEECEQNLMHAIDMGEMEEETKLLSDIKYIKERQQKAQRVYEATANQSQRMPF